VSRFLHVSPVRNDFEVAVAESSASIPSAKGGVGMYDAL
jgi:hypothetical protein